jgi:catechol 2,3-dioxygenase-like lactoylglutathione lyase family enzyme
MKKQGIGVLLVGCLAVCMLALGDARPEPTEARFSRATIDIGMVVADIETSSEFYQEVIGFDQVGSFDVAADMAGETGLTDYQAFSVRVFALGREPTATKLKIMAFPRTPAKKVDNEFISSSQGYSYLTIFVSDLTEALARLKTNAVTPVKKPYQLGNANNYLTLVKDPDGNIIELIGPMR